MNDAPKCYRHDYEHREYVCTCDPPVEGDTGREGARWGYDPVTERPVLLSTPDGKPLIARETAENDASEPDWNAIAREAVDQYEAEMNSPCPVCDHPVHRHKIGQCFACGKPCDWYFATRDIPPGSGVDVREDVSE